VTLRRVVVALLALIPLAAPLAAEAQPAGKVARIGVLLGTPPGPLTAAFRDGRRELGYIEGQNVILELRWEAGLIGSHNLCCCGRMR
jgi:putative ABC transport system substrate-binding protein